MTKGRGKRSGSRGRKKRDGGAEVISSLDVDAMIVELGVQSDRGVALIAGEVVNAALQVAIASHFRPGADESELFFKDGAPIATFSSRLKVADGLEIISPDERKGINAIRQIRNHFAHGIHPHTFDEESLASHFAILEPAHETMPKGANWTPLRRQYVTNCLVCTGRLLNRALFKFRARQPSLAELVRNYQAPKPEDV